jgi:hypothetical protein
MTYDPLDPPSVYYRVPMVVIDGPALPVGSEVGLRVLAVVAPDAPVVADGADRIPSAALRIVDWSGPWREPHNPDVEPAIAEHILDAAARGIAACDVPGWDVAGQVDDTVARAYARAAIEAVARRIRPTDDEAIDMVLGVLRLDIEKLKNTGDELATLVDRDDADDRARHAIALWNAQAHSAWAEYRATADRTPGDDTLVRVRVRTANLPALEAGVTLGTDDLTRRPIELRLVRRGDGTHDLEVVTGSAAKAATPDPVDPEIVP